MKKITLLMAAALLSFTGFSQAVEVSEDFEAGVPAGWSTVINTGNCDWALATDGPNGFSLNSQGMIFDDDDACGEGADAAPSNVSILSDVYDMSNAEGPVDISYDFYYDFIVDGDFLSVDVMVDGGAPVNLALYTGADIAFNNVAVSLGSIAAAGDVSTIQFMFTYDDGGGWAWSAGVDTFVLTYTNILGVSDNAIEGFSFAPNPAQDFLTLNAPNAIERASIVNILGQTVVDTKINATSTNLDISSLAAGTYILNVTVDGQIGTYHIIKE